MIWDAQKQGLDKTYCYKHPWQTTRTWDLRVGSAYRVLNICHSQELLMSGDCNDVDIPLTKELVGFRLPASIDFWKGKACSISIEQYYSWSTVHCCSQVKGAVSYRFSQGLLTLMCNNSKLKADINFFFFFFCCVDKHPKSITGCKNLWFNTRWLCYSVWGKTPVFHNSGFIYETILPISIFLFDNDTYMPSPQNGIHVCQLELYFWKYFIFCIKCIFFPVFSFLRNIDNYLCGVSKSPGTVFK